MKRILLDINIVLDVLLERVAHIEGSAAIWSAVEKDEVEGLVSAHAITAIYYFVRKEMGAARAGRVISKVLRVFGVAAVDSAVIEEALHLSCPDFEDAVSAAAARVAGCECIVTRDPGGFRGSPVRALTPGATLPLLAV